MQATRFGRAKGYALKNLFSPNRCGYLAAGFAKAPPNAGPKILPIVQTRGMTLKALGCSSLSGTSSATVVLIIPTFPLLKPAIALANIAQIRVLENPNKMQAIIVQLPTFRFVRPLLDDMFTLAQ